MNNLLQNIENKFKGIEFNEEKHLYLYMNQIVTFNPTIPLPSSLFILYLSNNQMTLAGYTASEVWANAQPAFTNPCNVYFFVNTDSITGTNLETILITKNCIITA